MTATSVLLFLTSGKNREVEAHPPPLPNTGTLTSDGRGKSQTISDLGLIDSSAWRARESPPTAYNLWDVSLWVSGWCLNFSLSEESISLKAQLSLVSWVIVPWELYFFMGKISSTQHCFLSSLIVILPAYWKADLVVCRAFICDGKMLTIINYFIVQQGCKIINWLFGR